MLLLYQIIFITSNQQAGGAPVFNCHEFHQQKFSEFRNPPAFIPQTPFCGRENSVSVLPNPNPQKNSLAKPSPHFAPPHCPNIFTGRTPKRKMSFPFSEKIHPREKENCKEHFFFLGLPSAARRWRGDCPSVRFSFKPPRAPGARPPLLF